MKFLTNHYACCRSALRTSKVQIYGKYKTCKQKCIDFHTHFNAASLFIYYVLIYYYNF